MFDSLSHHAFALAGQSEVVIPQLLKAIEKDGTKVRGNPDFRSETYDVFGIDEARELKEAAYRKAVSGSKKVFVISARGITKEAQNALLKVFEEPPEDTQFFLITPSLEILLPTLRSRLHILSILRASDSRSENQMLAGSAADFLAEPVSKRLKTIQGMLKEAEEESGKQGLATFLDDLERAVADKRGLKTGIHANADMVRALSEILEVKKYSRDRAPSFKLLLEHLALVLPRS